MKKKQYLKVRCPTCKYHIGSECHDEQENKRSPHGARIKLAKDLPDSQIDNLKHKVNFLEEKVSNLEKQVSELMREHNA